ncbi:hypothetical protein QRX36_20170, partial [Escherichia coli]|nr:hypothetical protein [Escherichia coli]
MRNKNIIMLLMSSLILSGCGPQPENKESQQQQPSTPTEQQVLAAQQAAIKEAEQSAALMNPLMILVKIIKLRWIHILSYDQMVSRKINNQTTRCANSIF